MAIIRYSSIVSAASGSVGSTAFVNSKGGAIARMRPHSTPAKRSMARTTGHILQRTIHAWLDLTDDQQAQWHALAVDAPYRNRLGLQRVLTGRQLYLKANIPRSRAGLTLHTTPPHYRDTGLGQLTSISFTEGGPYNISYTPPSPGTAGYLFVYGDRSFSTSGFKALAPIYIDRRRFTGAATTNVYTSWLSKHGDMESGELYHLGLQWFPDDGLQTLRAALQLTLS